MLSEKIIEILEDNEFKCYEVNEQDGGFYIEIEQYTPLGEDWIETLWFDGTDESFVNTVVERFLGFDVDDEVEVWLENRGKNGVPSSIRDLLEDAEWKKETLKELANDLQDFIEG